MPRLWALREAWRPAVLVECAFMSNPEEARRLGDDLDSFKVRLAVAVFKCLRASLLDEGDSPRRPKESINKAAYAYTNKHVGPSE